MHRAARALARLLRAASRRLGRSGGTTAPGRLLLALSPTAMRRMATGLDEGSVLVSATNGKTTTAAMVAAALECAGPPGGAQPGRVEHVLGRGHGPARRRARHVARSASSRWMRHGCPPWRTICARG